MQIQASNEETEKAKQALIESMMELTTLRVYQQLARKEQEMGPKTEANKAEAVKQVEDMLKKQKEQAIQEAKQRKVLLDSEMELQ